MKMNSYSVYDTATAAYMRPFFMQSDGQALRAFTDLATDAEHDIGKHPEHYSLVRLGTFDDNTGDFNNEKNSTITTGLQAVANSRKIDIHKQRALEAQIKKETDE